MARESGFYEHRNLNGLEPPHFQANRSSEKRISRQSFDEFAVVAIVQILLVRDLPNKAGGRQNNIALIAFAHQVLPIKPPFLVTPKPNWLGTPKPRV